MSRKKPAPVRRPLIRRLTIVIEARGSSDGSDVSTGVHGKAVSRIFDKGDEDWSRIKGAAFQAISAIGLSRYGRDVTITSEP